MYGHKIFMQKVRKCFLLFYAFYAFILFIELNCGCLVFGVWSETRCAKRVSRGTSGLHHAYVHIQPKLFAFNAMDQRNANREKMGSSKMFWWLNSTHQQKKNRIDFTEWDAEISSTIIPMAAMTSRTFDKWLAVKIHTVHTTIKWGRSESERAEPSIFHIECRHV